MAINDDEIIEKAFDQFFLDGNVKEKCPYCHENIVVKQNGSATIMRCKCGKMDDCIRGI